MSNDFDLNEYRRRMDGAVTALKVEFSGLRTGRASTALLDGLTVKAYGSEMPLNQVAGVSVPEPRMLSVTVWDKSQVAGVERALRESRLGLNPIVDGMTLRIPLPPLTEERRKELVKVAGTYSENAKIAVRNVRRDAMDTLKTMEKSGDMSEDEQKAYSSDVQEATDAVIGNIDKAYEDKSAEIMQV